MFTRLISVAFSLALPVFALAFLPQRLLAQNEEIAGTYQAVLEHEGTDFYQFARMTLRTVNVGGQIKISANVRVFFGPATSNEYLTYEYADVPLNILTRQMIVRADNADVSFIGYLRSGVLEGDWFSTLVGRVGKFKAMKTGVPPTPTNGVLVTSLSGYYRGTLTNTNPQSNLPERISTSFVTTQEMTPEGPSLRVTGNVRFYLGGFESIEYVETPFSSIQFNFYNRFMTAKTQDYGLTFKGTMSQDGQFVGEVLSDGLGNVGDVTLDRQ